MMMATIGRPLTSACAVMLAFQLLAPAIASAQLGNLGRRIAGAASDQLGREIESLVRDGVRCAFRDLACIEQAEADGKTPVMTDDDGNIMTDDDGRPMTDPNAAAAKASGFPELADKLDSCEAYVQGFTHPFTGESLEREVAGMTNDECLYVEGMPNGGKMECRYSEASRREVARYYRDWSSAQSSRTQAAASSGAGEEPTYTIDGEEVDNPLQESVSNGTCVVSGYWTCVVSGY